MQVFPSSFMNKIQVYRHVIAIIVIFIIIVIIIIAIVIAIISILLLPRSATS